MKIGDKYYLLLVNEHGGGCCGVKHISGFPFISSNAKTIVKQKIALVKDAVDKAIDRYEHYEEGASKNSRENWTCAINVVLIDSQLEQWQTAVEAVGFKHVLRFKNSNSGNYCNVFYLVTGKGEENGRL